VNFYGVYANRLWVGFGVDACGGILGVVEVPSGSRVADVAASDIDESERLQITERLGWTAKQRLDYLLDMLAF
jgi:hypothetical protein